MAIEVAKLQPVDRFKETTDEMIRALKAVEPAEGFERVMVPGEVEAQLEKRYREEGVPIRDEDWNAVAGIARRLKVKA